MGNRHLGLLAVAVLLGSQAGVIGQERKPAGNFLSVPENSKVSAQQMMSKPYKAPRTSDGQPDLQGYYTNLTYTPLERPKELAGKAQYTEAEAVAEFIKDVEFADDQILHYAHSDFQDTPVQSGAKPNRNTSLVVDPPDGRIPAYTPAAAKAAEARIAAQKARPPLPETSADVNPITVCTFNINIVPMMPVTYNGNYHIVQTKNAILFQFEWNSEHRVVWMDGRPAPPDTVRTYAGHSRGHWEGETLVIETTNFSPNRNFFGSPGTFKVTERLTRKAHDVIEYRYTIDDPATWVRPWTVEQHMIRLEGPMLEYACNENNQDAFATLKNARAFEKGLIDKQDATRRGNPKGTIEGLDEKATVIGVGGSGGER